MNWERFENLCKERGLSPTSVVISCGCEKSAVTRWRKQFYEKGRSNVTSETLIKFADFFSVTTDYLLGLSDRESSNAIVIGKILNANPRLSVLFDSNKKLSPDGVEAVLRYSEFVSLGEQNKED